MAAYDKRTIESIRHEYTLAAPAHWSEVDKAVDVANGQRSASQRSGFSVTDVTVTAEDSDLIIVQWTQERKI